MVGKDFRSLRRGDRASLGPEATTTHPDCGRSEVGICHVLGRMGSLNALELSARAGFWKKWLDAPACSADTMGRVHALMDAGGLRQGIHHIYERLKRNKALPDTRGMGIALLRLSRS